MADGRLRVISLDVGQGDAHVLISPSGRVLLVDAGFAGERFDVGESVVAPFLWQSGIGLIDALALTHAHPDHLGGAPFLLRSFRVSETWESVAAYREAAYRAVERAAAGRGVRRLSLRRGFSRDWDGVQIDVLGPAPRGRSSGRARNDDSLVLGLCFISEGAIPFMAKDPLRVIPVSVLGGALTGALSMFFGVQLMAPHGGLFVLLIPNAVNHVLLYLLSISAGSLVVGAGYALVKTGQAELPGAAAALRGKAWGMGTGDDRAAA